MTNETAPERIWAVTEPDDISAQILGEVYAQQVPDGMVGSPVEYVRADALEAAQARIAELEEALKGALDVIDDYLGYEHDGDPWTEDARQMGEMDINEYQRDGRLEAARAALEGKG